jgi:hypothetical protein
MAHHPIESGYPLLRCNVEIWEFGRLTGAYGMFRTAEGLTLGYLSGTYNSTAYPSAGGAPTDLRSHYSRGDVGKLCDMGKVRADIILSSAADTSTIKGLVLLLLVHVIPCGIHQIG